MVSSMFALPKHYVVAWRYNVMYMYPSNVPVVSWSRVADEPMTENDVYKLYIEAMRKMKREPTVVAMLTGEYQEKLDTDWYHIVIDIDDIGTDIKEGKYELARAFAKDGFVVVVTKRGFHIHARLPRNERVYSVSVVYPSDERAEKVGEGGSLMRHMWTSPPSRRATTTGGFTYSFMLPDGKRFARYDLGLLKDYEPPIVSFKDLESAIDSILGYRLIKFSPDTTVKIGPVKTVDPNAPIRHKPIFYDTEEFLARIHNFPIPTPVARVLYNYYVESGATPLARDLVSRYTILSHKNLLTKVPHGERFLVASEFILFVAHLVTWVKYSEVIEILSTAIEDWPYDDGMSLDKKLKYLVLFDEETHEYIYPRYNGLGALKPVSYCSICPLAEECKNNRMPPWVRIRKTLKTLEAARHVQRRRVYA